MSCNLESFSHHVCQLHVKLCFERCLNGARDGDETRLCSFFFSSSWTLFTIKSCLLRLSENGAEYNHCACYRRSVSLCPCLYTSSSLLAARPVILGSLNLMPVRVKQGSL